jgi:hypothetical protein
MREYECASDHEKKTKRGDLTQIRFISVESDSTEETNYN